MPTPRLTQNNPQRFTSKSERTNLTTRLSCIAWALAAIQLSGCVTVSQADQVSPARDAQLSYSPAPSTVVVRERGVIKVKPDIASVSIRFEIEKPTLDEARAALHDAIFKLTASAQGNGLAASDIETSNVRIGPKYAKRVVHSEPPKLIGYVASKTTLLTVRDLSTLAAVIDGVLKGGGSMGGISDVSLSVEDPSGARIKARDKAMRAANATATQLAQLGGVVRGPPLSIQESIEVPSGRLSKEVLFAHIRRSGTTPAVQDIAVAVNVSVTYALTKG